MVGTVVRAAVALALLFGPALPLWPGGANEPTVDAPAPTAEESAGGYAGERTRLVESSILGEGITDPAVLEAMRSVRRHEFVPPEYRSASYQNRPLPIGHGQTISQPYVVAYMTEVLELDSQSTVLEVGTGSGYQAAVLGEIVDLVHSIEIIEPLAESAAERLDRLGHGNVVVHQGDGYFGWEAGAPYDAIIVTAAAGHIPPPLLDQLATGGRMVIPVGPIHAVQQLILVEKARDGSVSTTQLLPVRFVPMTGRAQE
ncbi:MAG: protein-L-isoaspartate(D-aspartate) O-methyltransferase [Spirochaetota bacterium]